MNVMQRTFSSALLAAALILGLAASSSATPADHPSPGCKVVSTITGHVGTLLPLPEDGTHWTLQFTITTMKCQGRTMTVTSTERVQLP